MSFNVSIEEKHDYIRVDVSGERIRGQVENDAIAVWSNVAEVCNKNGGNCLPGQPTPVSCLPTPARLPLPINNGT